MSQYITTDYQCHKCQKQYEFSDLRNLQGIRQYNCKHYILKFIKNMDNNIVGYLVSIKCRKCSKKNDKQLFVFNNKNMIDFNSNVYNCCNNQINFAAFYSDTRLESINKIQQNNLNMNKNINNLNMNKSINNLNMNGFGMNNNNGYIRSNSDNLGMNNFNNQNMNNINQNNNNLNKGLSGNIPNTNFVLNFNNNQINNNNNNNFQNNNLNLMTGINMNQNMNNMNNQNARFTINNMMPNNQFNNNMNNLNNFQNNNFMGNNMNNNLEISQLMYANNKYSAVGQNDWKNYINDDPGYIGQQITFQFEFKQQYYYMSARNDRIFKDVLFEFLNGHPEIRSLLTYNQKYLFNGEMVDINKTLFELRIKNDAVVIIHWVDIN